MSALSIYTDIDTLFDTRRGIIENILIKNGHTWEDFKERYDGRKIDHFDAPKLGLTQTEYLKRFSARDIDDWCDDDRCYFYPSKIVKNILPLIRSIEFGSYKTIMVAEIKLFINMYPFAMSEGLQEQLIAHLTRRFKIPITIQIIDIEYAQQTADVLGSYDYVVRYGHLINPDFKPWFDTIAASKKSGVKIIVPDLLAKPIEDLEELEPLKNESAKKLISNMSMLQGGKCIFIPLDTVVFDYTTSD